MNESSGECARIVQSTFPSQIPRDWKLRTGRAVLLAEGLTALLVFGGCAGPGLYSEVRDKQGIAAKKVWEAVDLKELIDTERGNLNKLLEAELKAQSRLALSIRDHELRYMVNSGSLKEGLIGPLDERFKKVAGTQTSFDEAQSLELLNRTKLGIIDQVSLPIKLAKLAIPSCESFDGGTIPSYIETWLTKAEQDPNRVALAVGVRGAVDQVRTECAKKDDTVVYARFSTGTEIAAAWTRYLAERDALTVAEKAASLLQKNYNVALAAYIDVLASTKPNGAEKLDELRTKLTTAAVELEKRKGDPFVQRFLSNERLEALENLLKSAAEYTPGKPLPENASRAGVALVLIPTLVADANRVMAEAKAPLVAPMLLQRNFEQLKLEAANRDIAAGKAIVKLSKEIVDALYVEATQLSLARKELTLVDVPRGINAQDSLGLPPTEAFAKASVKNREMLYVGAGHYYDARNRLSDKRYRLEYLRIAAYHERALAYAEVNAKQWQSLISVTVDQVAAYGAGGIKAQSIAGLINTLSLIWIGSGVNK